MITDDIRIWAGRQAAEKSLSENWSPQYILPVGFSLYLDTLAAEKTPGITAKAGEITVCFMQISDEGVVSCAGHECERHYLEEIKKTREKFTGKRIADGVKSPRALWEFERWMAKNDLYYLAKYILGYDKTVFHLHKYMAGSVEDLPPGARELREFPRDTYKSTLLTISYSVQEVLKDPDVRILMVSNASDNASKKLEETKGHFIKNKALMQLFPEHIPKTRASEGSGSKWSSPAKTSVQAEGNYSSAGVGTSKTSQHYDIIIADDYWDEKCALNPEVMTKCKTSISNLKYLLAAPKTGKIIFIGTRFAYDDPTSSLQKNANYHCVIVSGITPSGRCLFPEQMSLRSFWGDCINDDSYVFACQIMLNPSREDASFKRSWFRYMEYGEIKKAEARGDLATRCVILTDGSGKDKDSSDPVAIIALIVDSKKRFTVVEYINEKLAPSSFLDQCFALYDRFSAELLILQKAPLEGILESFISDRNNDRIEGGRRPVSTYYCSLKGSKQERMRGLQPYYQRGQIYHDPGVVKIHYLEEEILSYPFNMSNDDGMDALSGLSDPVVNAPPRFNAPEREERYARPTRKGVRVDEVIYRKTQAHRAFESAKNNGVGVEYPGMVQGVGV